jgi:hypothetical protein
MSGHDLIYTPCVLNFHVYQIYPLDKNRETLNKIWRSDVVFLNDYLIYTGLFR